MDIENGLHHELGVLPRLKQHGKVIEDSTSVFRLQLSAPVRSGHIADHTSRSYDCDNKDSGREAPSLLVTFQEKRKVDSSFDLTASSTATDEGEASIEIGRAHV